MPDQGLKGRLVLEVRTAKTVVIVRDRETRQLLAVIPTYMETLSKGTYEDPVDVVRILVHIATRGQGAKARLPADPVAVYRVVESIFLNPGLTPEERVKLALEAVQGLRHRR